MTPDKNNFQLLLQELEGLRLEKLIGYDRDQVAAYNSAIDDCIEIVTKHTAPQPNWDTIDDLVKVYANDTATSDKHYDGILNYWRKLIGYTLDANGKPVAIQKGGEDDTR